MPFGKYKGEDMDDIPATYLDWLRGQEWVQRFPFVQKYLEDNKMSIDSELGVEK
jgi:uncharacterized protein (DUF3820 family)